MRVQWLYRRCRWWLPRQWRRAPRPRACAHRPVRRMTPVHARRVAHVCWAAVCGTTRLCVWLRCATPVKLRWRRWKWVAEFVVVVFVFFSRYWRKCSVKRNCWLACDIRTLSNWWPYVRHTTVARLRSCWTSSIRWRWPPCCRPIRATSLKRAVH